MAEAATSFLASLAADQRSIAQVEFSPAAGRKTWHYTPVERAGLMLKQMDATQINLAHRLLATGLSGRGVHEAKAIISLEPILGEMERWKSKWKRDSARYYVTIFGTPGDKEKWGWRFEGHHISVNFTIVNGEVIGPTPLFLGSNPARVLHGDQEGLRALIDEEDVARDLLSSLDADQKRVAIVHTEAPSDILTRNSELVTDELQREPAGLSTRDMSTAQRATLRQLIEVYVGRLPDSLADQELRRVIPELPLEVRFAWSGSEERGRGHYYRVVGSTFLAEYDCTQNDANHIHAVWRDLINDFGEDALRRHYVHSH